MVVGLALPLGLKDVADAESGAAACGSLLPSLLTAGDVGSPFTTLPSGGVVAIFIIEGLYLYKRRSCAPLILLQRVSYD